MAAKEQLRELAKVLDYLFHEDRTREEWDKLVNEMIGPRVTSQLTNEKATETLSNQNSK